MNVKNIYGLNLITCYMNSIAYRFGLGTSPYVFTKILKPVAHFIESKGLISVIYLDAISIIINTEEAFK